MLFRASRLSVGLMLISSVAIISGCKDGKPPTWNELTGNAKTESSKSETGSQSTKSTASTDPSANTSTSNPNDQGGPSSDPASQTGSNQPSDSPFLAAITKRYGSLAACEKLNLAGAKLLPAQIAELKKLPGLKTLVLSRCALASATMEQVGQLKGLVNLKLNSAEFNSRDLEYLAHLANLRWLDVSDTGITDQDLSLIKGLQLDVLQVGRTQITGYWFSGKGADKWFGGGLKMIDADGTQFSQAGFVYIKGSPELEVLMAFQCGATDFQLTGLKGCTNLRVLSLVGNSITDAGALAIKPLSKLERIDLSKNGKLTERAMNALTSQKGLVQLNPPVTFGPQALALLKQKYHPNIEYKPLTGPEDYFGPKDLWKIEPLVLQ